MTFRRLVGTAILSVSILLLAAGACAGCESSIGIEGGVDWTKASFSSDTPGFRAQGSARTGPEGGLIFSGQCADHFGLALEALYVRRETKFSFPQAGGLPPIDALYKVDYIDFPLTAYFLLAEDDSPIRPILFVGPSFSARIRAKSENTADGAIAGVRRQEPDPLDDDFDCRRRGRALSDRAPRLVHARRAVRLRPHEHLAFRQRLEDARHPGDGRVPVRVVLEEARPDSRRQPRGFVRNTFSSRPRNSPRLEGPRHPRFPTPARPCPVAQTTTSVPRRSCSRTHERPSEPALRSGDCYFGAL